MILTCPACATRFLVPDAAFGASGRRRVRCGRCRHEWSASRTGDAAAPIGFDAPAPALAAFPQVPIQPVPAGSALPARSSRFSRGYRKARARPGSLAALALLLTLVAAIAVLALSPALLAQLRQTIAPTPLAIENVTTRYVPQVAEGAAAGASTVAPDGVTADAAKAAPVPTAWSLVVEGTVKNGGSREAEVPPLILLTRDKDGALLGSYRPQVQQQHLSGGAATGFAITLGAADPKLAEVTVQFAAQ